MIKTDMKLLASIFMTFLRIGPVTFGGGYAIVSVIEREIVEKKKWLTTQELTDIFAVSQSVPGAIAINSAAFIGFRMAGILGTLAAMAGILLPTFCIVMVLSAFYLEMKDQPKIEAAFIAIRPTIIAFVSYAALKIGKAAVVDRITLLLVGVTVVLMYVGQDSIHPVVLIVGGGLAGISIKWFLNSRCAKTGTKLNHEKEESFDYMI